MRGKHGNHARGSAHPRWNSGALESEHGYRKIRVGVSHPLADPNGYAYEHLLVWVGAGNQPPAPWEVLHHRNEDKADNRIGNLEKIDRQTHAIRHGQLKLHDADIVEIRRLYASGQTQSDIASKFGVGPTHVSRIVRGAARKAAGGPSFPGDNRRRAPDGKFQGKLPRIRQEASHG